MRQNFAYFFPLLTEDTYADRATISSFCAHEPCRDVDGEGITETVGTDHVPPSEEVAAKTMEGSREARPM
jgi:hypothetical protein